MESIGIGVDIENIARFVKQEDNTIFLKRLFTENELAYCLSKKQPAPHLTARYAGKEAVIKAVTSLGHPGLQYRDIEITNTDNEVPVAKILRDSFQQFQIRISLSHCDDKAIAFVIASPK
jgi:holo-[acyl-carrier protein] synthase